MVTRELARGDRVLKVSGDYHFEGVVVAVFQKRSGTTRYVIENDHGLLFIFNSSQLDLVSAADPTR